jgi:hypothetical protein
MASDASMPVVCSAALSFFFLAANAKRSTQVDEEVIDQNEPNTHFSLSEEGKKSAAFALQLKFTSITFNMLNRACFH